MSPRSCEAGCLLSSLSSTETILSSLACFHSFVRSLLPCIISRLAPSLATTSVGRYAISLQSIRNDREELCAADERSA